MKTPTWLQPIFAKDAALFRAINDRVGRFKPLDGFGIVCGRWLLWLMFVETFLASRHYAKLPFGHEHAVALALAGTRGTVAAAIAFLGNWVFSRFAFRPRPFVQLRGEKLLAP